MRSLSGTLLAAQKAASGRPYVEVLVKNNMREGRHLPWVEEYSDGSADAVHDAEADATYLHRVRVNAGDVQYQRNASASWTTVTLGASVAQVSIAATGTRVCLFANDGANVYYNESTDSGGSWGGWVAVGTGLAAAPDALAVEYTSAGGNLVFLYEVANGLRRKRRTSGTLGSGADWTLAANSINGVDAVKNIDLLIVVSGTDGDDRPTVWTCQLGEGVLITLDTWAEQFIVVQAETEEAVTFRAPFITQIAADGTVRVTYVEKYTGTGAYTRTMLTQRHPFILNPLKNWEWMDPVPLENTTEEGLAITAGKTPDKAFLSRPGRVTAAATAIVTLDMSADLVEATVWERDGLRTGGELVFENSGGEYLGPPATIALHRDVTIGLGYGSETSTLPVQTIVGWEYRRAGGRGLFVLHTRGNAYWLARSRPRTTIVLSAVKLTDITRGAAVRAGLEYGAVGASTRSQNFSVDWVMHPHQNGLGALEAVGELVADVFRSGGASHRVILHEPLAGDSVDYAFGTDHVVYSSRTRSDEAVSFAEIVADGALGQALDFGVMNSDKPLQDRRVDPHATSEADADAHASARLRKGQEGKDLGELVVPPHVGLEVTDVVSYLDVLASGSTIVGRVVALETKYRRAGLGRTPMYEQKVGLGGL